MVDFNPRIWISKLLLIYNKLEQVRTCNKLLVRLTRLCEEYGNDTIEMILWLINYDS